MRKPNYRFERAERDRLKLAKKEEKAKRQHQERASDQKSDEAGQPAAPSAVSDNDITPVCVTAGFVVG
jgi:hypothetical protein